LPPKSKKQTNKQSREIEGRTIALVGYMQFLKDDPQSVTSSQARQQTSARQLEILS